MHCDATLAEKTGNGELTVWDFNMAKELPKEWQCRNNPWVKCLKKKKCEKCGWNPEVAEKRMEARTKTASQK